MTGDGTMKWGDGREYTGQWLRNLKHGKGKLIEKDRSVYEGFFYDD